MALVATRKISASSEITLNYGSSSSLELLHNYGFVSVNNPVDKYMLQKGGDGVLKLDEWTTTLDEDRQLLDLATNDRLRTILQFRVQIKGSY